MKLTTYSLREWQQRPGRALLTLAGIIIGVAAMVSISVTIEATRNSYRHMFDTVTGRASLEIVAEGYGGFDPSIGESIRELSGVRAVVPVVQTTSGLIGPSGAEPIMVLGIKPELDSPVRDYKIKQGKFLNDRKGVVLSSTYAQRLKLKLGESVRLITPKGLIELPIVGLLEPEGAATVHAGAIVFMHMSTAQQAFALDQQVNAVQIVLDEDTNLSRIQKQMNEQLPPGLTAQAPAVRGKLAQEMLLGTELSLGVMSIVALVAGAFVILNSFLMSLGERVRHLAILRALGTRRLQLKSILLKEAAILGSIGTVLGIGLGYAMSFALNRIMEEMLAFPVPKPQLDAKSILLATLLGPGVALAAALVPAWRSSRRPVLDGLLDNREIREPVYKRWPGYIGLGLLMVGLTFIALLLTEKIQADLASQLLPACMALLIVSGTLTIPLCIPFLSKTAALILRPFLGVEGRMAVRWLSRRPTRTGLTVAVLTVTLIVAVGFGNATQNSVRDIQEWAAKISYIDYYIRGYMPGPGMAVTAALPESMADVIAEIEHVEFVTKINFIAARAEGEPVMVIAKSFGTRSGQPIDLVEGDETEVMKAVKRGEVVLGTRLSQRKNLKIGDHVTLETRNGPKAVRVAGLATEYTAGGFVVYLEWNQAQEFFGKQGVHVFGVVLENGAPASVATGLQTLCDERKCRLESRAEFRQIVDEAMSGVVGTLWGLIALGFVIASVGIVNTLSMNVLEQTREIGILRAIAMKRRQITKMIFSQALVVGVISLIPGIVGGIVFAYLLNVTTYPMTGLRLDLRFEMPLIVGSMVMVLVLSIFAAMFPARRASRLQVITALQYE